MFEKKLSNHNVEERYWFEPAPKLAYNVPAKVIFINILLNYETMVSRYPKVSRYPMVSRYPKVLITVDIVDIK